MDSRQSNQHFSRLLPQQRPLQAYHQTQNPPPPPPPYSSQGRPATKPPSLQPSSDQYYQREAEPPQRARTPPILRREAHPLSSSQKPISASPQRFQGPPPSQTGGYHSRHNSLGAGGLSANGSTIESPQGEHGPSYDQCVAGYTSVSDARPAMSAFARQPLLPTSVPSPRGTVHQMSQGHLIDETRRRSLGGSPPRVFRAISDHPPPPPPPYSSRHMPPPSSPQQLQPAHSYSTPLSRGPPPPPPPPFSSGRDLPGLSSINRPGSSMSISSMLDSGSEPQPRESATPSSQYPPQPLSTSQSMPAPSAAQNTSPLGGIGYSPYRRQQTPERIKDTNLRGPNESRANSAGSPSGANFGIGATSPERPRAGPLPPYNRPYNSYASITKGPQPAAAQFSTDGPHGLARHTMGDALPPRPNSQPSGPTALQNGRDEAEERALSRGTNIDAQSRQQATDVNFSLRHASRVSDQDAAGGTSGQSDQSARTDDSTQRAIVSQSNQGTPFARHQPMLDQRDMEVGGRGYPLWGVPTSQHPFSDRQKQTHAKAVTSRAFGSGFRSYSNMSQSPFVSANPFNGKSELRQADPPYNRSPHMAQDQQKSPLPLDGIAALDRQRQTYSQTPTPSAGVYQTGSNLVHDQQQKGSEDSSQPRNLLSVGSDNNRKGGRISPLPQAVQGAQAQMSGPGGEPGIKSEFGRMFSGIGSGVGSATSSAGPINCGTQTPFSQSPSNRDIERNIPSGAGGETGDSKVSRASSKGRKRGRKVKNEDNKVESESGDGRGTPSLLSARGARKSKHSHSHHHHHQHPHHHHHHPPKPDDGITPTISAGTTNPTVNNLITTKRSSTPLRPPSTAPTVPGHHHHHHPHHHHHHHHPSKPPIRNITPPRKPIVTIKDATVINDVSKLPRHHLGSSVYAPRLTLPSSTASHESLKLGYASTPTPIPRCEGKANCTFIVRVPCQYLLPERRKELVLRRAVWGTSIYTDDSDPLAVAIHGGWIRGEWDGDVDLSLLDLSGDESKAASTRVSKARSKIDPQNQRLLTTPPATGPMAPPAKKDLHITLLILPRLQEYTASTMHGLRSRSWGGNHDGMSFKILKVSWVTEGVERGEPRGGEAKRRRLNAYIESRKETIKTMASWALKSNTSHGGMLTQVVG
ncbi:MAG: hypothetical protein M1835_003563 [Candelina submexicana]|nr:MAG: hypothetical protein M1835_003563 [Candelina submexicana]